jgi:hypothetical protein
MQDVRVILNLGLSTQNQRSALSNLLSSKMGLNLRKKLLRYHIGYIAVYGAETWTLRRINQ